MVGNSTVSKQEYNARYYREVTKPNRKAIASKLSWQGVCSYCGTHGTVEGDHKIPRSRGGTDDDENMTAACRRCNSSKRNISLDEWRILIGRSLQGIPYFSPRQIRFLADNGFDLPAEMRRLAQSITFFFEDGDGAAVRKYFSKGIDRRA